MPSDSSCEVRLFNIYDFHLPNGPEDSVEDILKYNHGGFRPTIIDDILSNRYQVKNKLGHGGFSTVWLCRDLEEETWVAIKIFAADAQSHSTREADNCKQLVASLDSENLHRFSIAREQFTVDSPQGLHQCLVHDVHGPSVKRAMELLSKSSQVRQVCHDLTRGLDSLHSHGFCHRDFRPANILLSLANFSSLPPEQVHDILGVPCIADVMFDGDQRLESLPAGEPFADKIPPYLVFPAPFENFFLTPTCDTRIIDFGIASYSETSHSEGGIPTSYAAPELVLRHDHIAAMAADLWALACTIFEVRTGFHLIEIWFLSDQVYLDQVAGLLGVPQHHTWANREGMWEKHGSVKDESTLRMELIKLLGECHPLRFPLGPRESHDLADLLAKLIKWEPDDRVGTGVVLKHQWFAADYQDEEMAHA